jgi:hypothetical protein
MKISSKENPTNNISHTDRWEKRYQELVEFKKEFGHCNVPGRWAENKQLGRWVDNQRYFFKCRKLSVERVQRLRHIGFRFNPRDESWNEVYALLMEFKKSQGHCNVPEKGSGNTKLARWIIDQRIKWKKGKLSEAHIQRLNRLGFVWQMHDASWDGMYSRLLRFKDKWGHCELSYKLGEDKQLSRWVRTQRTRRNRGLLKDERITLLDEIGFKWLQTFKNP